jgi:hypothetical protein
MSSANFQITCSVTDTSAGPLGNYQGVISLNAGSAGTISLTSADVTKVYAANRSGGSPDVFTLDDGSLTDAYGNALTFAEAHAVVIKNTHASATLTVGGGTDPLFGSDQYTLKAGQLLPITSPFTVDGTHKQITITPSAAATYSVIVLGE